MQTEEELRLNMVPFSHETRIACLRSALDLAGQAIQVRDREIARLHDLLGKLLAERLAAAASPGISFPSNALRHSR